MSDPRTGQSLSLRIPTMGWLWLVGSIKIVGIFCKRALQKRRYSAKETYDLVDPTHRSHPILHVHVELVWIDQFASLLCPTCQRWVGTAPFFVHTNNAWHTHELVNLFMPMQYILLSWYGYCTSDPRSNMNSNNDLTNAFPPKNEEIALWSNTLVVKCKYCVLQKRNETNHEIQWYNM